MRGNITRRGKSSWRVKFDVGTTTGKREIRYVTVRGSKREAQTKLAELIASVGAGRAKQDGGGRICARPRRPVGGSR
jgi:integrase